MLSAGICIPMIPAAYRFTPHLPHTHPRDQYTHTHTHAHTFIHSISLPNHCHYKSQQLLLHALIINHNCFIFPYLFNVAVRDSRGRKGGGGETEEEKPKESLLRRRKMRLEQRAEGEMVSNLSAGISSPLAFKRAAAWHVRIGSRI